jgi:ADP-ribose pyrophosphatase YjhB (NUDIX family)
VCGSDLRSEKIKENEPPRLKCSKCDFVFYLDPKLVACSIVEIDGKIILLRRSSNPERGKWVVPGGYVDRGEAVETAAIRETREECGIDTNIKSLLGVYSYEGYLEVVVMYLAEHLSGNPVVGDESLEIKLFDPEEIPWDNLAFNSTTDALRDYCELIK